MTESDFWVFIYGMLSVYPFFFLRHVPVMDRLKIPFWRLLLYATVIMIVQGLSYLWLSQIFPFDAPVLTWHRKIFMLPYVLLTLTFSKDSVSKTLFMDFFMVGFVMAVIDVTYIFNRTWFAESFNVAPYRTDVLVRSALTLIIYPPLYFLFKKILRPIMKITSISLWMYLTAIPLTFAAISIITTMEAFDHDISPVILAIRFFTIVGSMIICALLSKIVEQMEQTVKAQEQSKHTEGLLALQGMQYQALAQNIEQTRATRHDLRHQLAAISVMVKDEDYDKLREFVESYRETLPTDSGIVLCENYAANSVMRHYIALAHAQRIDNVDIQCTLPSDSCVEDVDLCVLIGNLLENAIEGCITVPIEQRKIRVRINRYLGELLLTVDNRFDGDLDMDHGELCSRKRGEGRKGVGLSSVKAIANKYDGNLQWENKNGWFMVSVRMGIG